MNGKWKVASKQFNVTNSYKIFFPFLFKMKFKLSEAKKMLGSKKVLCTFYSLIVRGNLRPEFLCHGTSMTIEQNCVELISVYDYRYMNSTNSTPDTFEIVSKISG